MNMMTSTPKVKLNDSTMVRPVRQRNFGNGNQNESSSYQHNSMQLPYGEPSTIKVATDKGSATIDGLGGADATGKSSIFEGWPLDLGSKLENLFKPLSLSP